MSVTAKKRRRWPWILLGVLLAAGGPLSWHLRPLNSTERSLIGRWKSVRGIATVTLSSDGRFRWESVDEKFIEGFSATHRSQPLLRHMVDSRLLTMEGTWSATSSSLSFHDDVDGDNFVFLSWLGRLRAYVVSTYSSTTEVLWHSPERFEMCGQEFVRDRE